MIGKFIRQNLCIAFLLSTIQQVAFQIHTFNNIQTLNNKMRSTSCIFIGLLACILLMQVAVAQKKLIFVQELFRHGARYPIFPTKDLDKTDYVINEHSQGELTTEGKNMHYLLGKAMYNTYWNDLFGGTEFRNQYNNSKFYFKATDVNRTIESCQSHLMGLFDSLPKLEITSAKQASFSSPLWEPAINATVGNVFPTAVQYHPLPVHVERLGSAFNDNGDFLRAYTPDNCPNQHAWQKENQQTKYVQEIYANANFTAALEQLGRQIKKNVSFEDAGNYYDNFECTYYMQRETLPVFLDPKYKRDLEYIYMLDLFINLFYTETQIRTTANGFFEATLRNINNAIKNRNGTQWVIYSAHDTTVGNMLAALNLTNVACIYEAYLKGQDYNKDTCISKYPGYTASLVFEVWEDKLTGLASVKVRYLGKYRKMPFCNYEEECTVSKLENWYNTMIKVDSYAANCGLYNEDKQFYKAFAILEFGVILGFLIYWLLKHLKRPRHDMHKTHDNNEVKAMKQAILKDEIDMNE